MSDGPHLVYAPTPQEEVRRPVEPARPRRDPRSLVHAASRAPGYGCLPAFTTPGAGATPARGGAEAEAEELARLLASGPLDTTGVRILHGPLSAALTTAEGADAVTIGTDIHLAPGHPSMASPDGRLLLAHELVHVWQQTSGRAPYGRRQPRRTSKVPPGKRFKIHTDEELDPEALMRAFVTQYYLLTRPQDVDRIAAQWHWTPKPRSAGPADAHRGYLWVNVYNDPADRGFATLSKADRDAVNAESDRRFFEQTGLPSDTRLGTDAKDAELRAKWRGVRANLLAEHEQARALRALPDDISKILFAGGRTITPDEYGAALDLAERIGKLSPAERARYLATVNASTSDLAELAKSVELFERKQKWRAADEEAFDEASTHLFGLEELYSLWKAKNRAEQMADLAPVLEGSAAIVAGVTVPGSVTRPGHYERAKNEAQHRFQAALARSAFKTEADFVDAVTRFRNRFRTQTVNLAMDVLAGYDHLLYVAKLKFRDTDAAQRLVGAISASGAAADYAAAADKEAEADLASTPLYDDLPGRGARLYPGNPIELRAEAKHLRESGSAKVVTASGNEPIIDPHVLGRKTDRERLSTATADDARSHLLDMIDQRLQDTARVRAELTEDPERVYSQDKLIQASFAQHGIDGDSIYGQIVLDHMQEISDAHLFSTIVQTLILLILAVLVPGGGWVAAAALVASAGLSTMQALDALADYEREEPEYALGFIQDEPSLFWVGVAVVGAAFDLGMTAAQLFKATAPALLRLQKPLTEFAAAKDVETAAAKLRTLHEQIDAVEGMQRELKVALKARSAAELAFKRALTGGGRLNAAVTGLEPIFEALYYAVKRGVTRVTALRKEKELIAAFTQVTKLEGAGLEELSVAYTRVRKAIEVGEKAGMDEATLLTYVDRLAEEHAGGEEAFKTITKEMRSWKPPTREQVLAQSRLDAAHENLLSWRKYQAELEAERADMKAGRIPADRDRLTEITHELEEIKGVSDRPGAPLRKEGRLKEAVREFEQSMLLAERAGLDPKVLMRSAFNASAERQAVLNTAKNVDKVGVLLRSSGEIEVDHIVSLQRMTEMEGFDKLRLGERRALATRADNLVAMDRAANNSKRAWSWATWRDSGLFYDEATVTAMKGRDAALTATIQKWILDTVKGR